MADGLKITDMNREQLRDYMRASREIHRYDANNVVWKQAFKLANIAGLGRLDMDCTSCIRKVKEWLEK